MDKFLQPIRNPMTIVALFIGLTEIGFGVGLTRADATVQANLLNWMGGLASATLGLFFITLLRSPHHFYGPGDFRDESNYLTLNRRIESAANLAAVVDGKIESMPLYQYPQLSKPAKTLFLVVYRHLKAGGDPKEPADIWEEFRSEDQSDAQQKGALLELEKIGWLAAAADGSPFTRTDKGADAYRKVAEFVYARWF